MKERIGPVAEKAVSQLKDGILASARIDTPQLAHVDSAEVDSVLDQALGMLSEFEAAGRPHPAVHADTDVITVLAGPGAYDSDFPSGEKLDRYQHLPWSRKMDRARIRVGVALAKTVTALRLNKTPSEVTLKDLAQHGPWFHYATTREENQATRFALTGQETTYFPVEKIFMYDTIVGKDGKKRPIVNTEDKMEGLHFPPGAPPRRIAVVSHAPHIVRSLFMLGKHPDRIPPGAVIQPFPIVTPEKAWPEYPHMELQGTLAAIYKFGTASKSPHPYTV